MIKQKKTPERRCVGCMNSYDKRTLIRVVRSPEGEISLDATGKKSGRGAYICKNPDCFKKAKKSGALSRNLNTPIPEEIYAKLAEQLEREAGNG